MIEIEDPASKRPELSISPDDAFFILMRAREFDGKTPESDPDSGSNPSDDKDVDILEDRPDDLTEAELVAAVETLNDDAQTDLIALVWLGRGDFSLAEWEDAKTAAQDIGRERAPRYICGIPQVSDFLEDGLGQIGLSLEDYMGDEYVARSE